VRALTLKGVVVLSRIVGVLATVRNLPARTPRHFSSPLAAGTFLHVGIVVKDIAGALTRFNRVSKPESGMASGDADAS
jgi:hypothetical protein